MFLGRWGWRERSYFGRVVWLQCQTSDQVPVLQEVSLVVCRVGGGGVHFVKVVSPLCQTSNRVHVLREILGVWPVGVGGVWKELFWESGLTPVSNFWSGPCAARDHESCDGYSEDACQSEWLIKNCKRKCGLCQGMKVHFNPRSPSLGRGGGGVLISSFRARGHYNKESKQLRFLATYVNRKFAIFSC